MVDEASVDSAEPSVDSAGPRKYLLFVWTPTGYRLEERQGEVPSVGSEIEVGDAVERVTKIGVSPLPGDSRPCAYLLG